MCADAARGIIGARPFTSTRSARSTFAADGSQRDGREDCRHDMRATPRFFGTIMSWLCPCGVVYLMHAQKGAESIVEAVRLMTDRAPPGIITTLVYDMACALSSSFLMRDPHMASTM